MKKKIIAIILESIPVLCAALSILFLILPSGSNAISKIMPIATLVAFLGFAFFFIGRKLNKKDKIVKILGIADLLSTLYVIILYTIAIFSFGL